MAFPNVIRQSVRVPAGESFGKLKLSIPGKNLTATALHSPITAQ